MEEEIVDYLKEGYRIICRTDKWAQLWRPRVFSYGWFFTMFILFFGFGGLIYAGYYLAKREVVRFPTRKEASACQEKCAS